MEVLSVETKQQIDLLEEFMASSLKKALHEMGDEAKELSFFCETEVEAGRRVA
ncbi:MAG: hypothetical protein ACJA0N_000687 [Pseudohongiellaceae bacterium]|jgi:hypothetical protein